MHRVGRAVDLLQFSTISPVDAELPHGGNRFDVPGGSVLYTASTVPACFGETLARFRVSPKIREILAEEGQGTGFMVCGGIPQDWRLQRSIGTIRIRDALPFVDVESPHTHEYLSEVLAPDLTALGHNQPLDVGSVRGPDRRISRLIARHLYTAVDEGGEYLYSGIRYVSRIRDDWECWAIFEGTHLYSTEQRAIERNDPDLLTVAELWGLNAF